MIFPDHVKAFIYNNPYKATFCSCMLISFVGVAIRNIIIALVPNTYITYMIDVGQLSPQQMEIITIQTEGIIRRLIPNILDLQIPIKTFIGI